MSIRIHSCPFVSIRVHSCPFVSIRVHSCPFVLLLNNGQHFQLTWNNPIRPFPSAVPYHAVCDVATLAQPSSRGLEVVGELPHAPRHLPRRRSLGRSDGLWGFYIGVHRCHAFSGTPPRCRIGPQMVAPRPSPSSTLTPESWPPTLGVDFIDSSLRNHRSDSGLGAYPNWG